ncbi:diguanylate cyclase [Neptunicella marina]|uniref:Diguanylate cyclase DosC n=1 Tax=Neptunicella marina TaxID=2125989 RepID=A0A8J6IRU8_9ALTE|nr:GGDEF domain-containing protein [Neptunicella marina]
MKRTEQTLLEQLQINDVEIARRKELLGLTTESLEQLASHMPVIEEKIDFIVDEFYQKQTEIDEISLLIGDADTLKRLRSAQRFYVMDLFAGNYGTDYVNNRLRIGMVHKRIGVEPKLYLSAVMTLKETLFNALNDAISDSTKCIEIKRILDKLMCFDTTLVFDTYIDSLLSEIESAKRRTEIYAKGLEDKVAERTRQLEEQTRRDPLTGIFNFRAMQDVIQREIALAKRRNVAMSLVYIDVDDFKEINDEYGHLIGDEVLKNLASYMLRHIRETDVACRYGGDEFCIIFPDCHVKQAKIICQKIIRSFSSTYPDYSLSMGISELDVSKNTSVDEFISLSDGKMYQAKEHQGNRIVC